MSDPNKRDHAIRARAFAEAAARLLYQAQLETIGAIGHVDSNTRAVTEVMQQADQLLPLLDHLIQRTLP